MSVPIYRTQQFINHQIEASEERGFQRALDKIFETVFTSRIYNTPELFNNEKLTAAVNEINDGNKSKCPSGYFITINPKYQDPDKLFELAQKLTGKEYIQHFVFSIEFRTEGGGNHLHLYFRSENKPFSQVKREFQTTCRSHIGNPKHCNVKSVKLGTEQSVIDYLSKTSQTDQTKRKLYGLADVYVGGVFEEIEISKNKKLKIQSLVIPNA